MNREKSALQIYTIGHGNCPLPEFLRLLHVFAIQTVMDVRSTPYSRYNTQYNREPLQADLQQAGIEYVYAGHLLGGRPEDDSCYRLPRNAAKTQGFRRSLDYDVVMTKDFFRKGIENLLAIARIHHVAVMCSEEDPQRCHRHHLIGRHLHSRGVDVLHIRRDGSEDEERHFAEQLRLL